MAARLTLICHASTDAVRKRAFPADELLDHLGQTKAAALAGQVPKADQCWTSPELRARETAAALGLDAAVEAQLRDCDYGSWKGRTFDEMWTQAPDAVSQWLLDPEAAPHGGESIASLMRRTGAWLDAQRSFSGAAIVVTHAAVIRAAVVHAIEAAPKSFWRIDIAPLSMTRLSGDKERWNLVALGALEPPQA